MKQIINFFLKLNIYNIFHRFFGRKIFKFFKIFFVDTDLKEIPHLNHPLKIDYNIEFDKYKKIISSNCSPFTSYSHILDLIKITEKFKKKEINFLDYGAGSLELFAYLSKNIKKIKYFYKDQEEYSLLINKIKKNNNLKKLEILEKNNINKNLDFAYFGGSLQYINGYRKMLKKILKKSKFIIISQTPFYFNEKKQSDIVLKQLNLADDINYLYLINYNSFLKFMKKNKFNLVSKNYNRVIKFLNFKNLKNKYHKIDMYDLLFEKK